MPWPYFPLLLGLLAVFAPLLIHLWPRTKAWTPDGRAYFIRRTGGGRAPRVLSLSMDLACGFPFELDVERASDRLFKNIGYLVEAQTGDPSFDARVYIACDDPALGRLLREQAKARAAVLAALDSGFFQIGCDGRLLTIRIQARLDPDSGDVARLISLGDALAPLTRGASRSDEGPYAMRSLAIDSACRFIGAYGLGSGMLLLTQPPTVLLDMASLTTAAVAVGTTTLALFALGVWSVARTARVGRHTVGWSVLLLLGLAPASLQAAIEANILLDPSTPTTVRCAIASADAGQRADLWNNLVVLHECTPEGAVSPPLILKIQPDTFREISTDGALVFEVHRGALGGPWIQDVRPG